MPQLLILLCEPLSAPYLEQFARSKARQTRVRTATGRAALDDALRDAPKAARLIAFCANTIVRAKQIEAVCLTPYNIHPGPPAYPGVHPDAFAHADGVGEFGATAHVLTKAIDAGPIIATATRPVPAGAARVDFANLGFACALDLFRLLVQHCLEIDEDFPLHPDAAWCGPHNTLKSYHARFGSFAASCTSHACEGAESSTSRIV